MAFGRCEIINLEKNIQIKDYQAMSLNFLFKDLYENRMQLTMPEDVYFVVSSISVWSSKKPIDDPSKGVFESLAFAMLKCFGISLIVTTKDDTIVPIERLPLDFAFDTKGVPSLSSKPFSILKSLGVSFVLSPKNNNYLLVEKIVESVMDSLFDKTLGLIIDDFSLLDSIFNRAFTFLMNNVYISLNGYYTKNIFAYLETKDVLDLKTAYKRRVYWSLDVSPKIGSVIIKDNNGLHSTLHRKIKSPYWVPNIKKKDGYSGIFDDYKVINGERYAVLEFSLPTYNDYLLIKDLKIDFSYLPNPQIVGGTSKKVLAYSMYRKFVKETGSGYTERVSDMAKVKLKTSDGGEDLKRCDIANFYINNDGILTPDRLDEIKATPINGKEGFYFVGMLPESYVASNILNSMVFDGEISFTDEKGTKVIKVPSLARVLGDDLFISYDKIAYLTFRLYFGNSHTAGILTARLEGGTGSGSNQEKKVPINSFFRFREIEQKGYSLLNAVRFKLNEDSVSEQLNGVETIPAQNDYSSVFDSLKEKVSFPTLKTAVQIGTVSSINTLSIEKEPFLFIIEPNVSVNIRLFVPERYLPTVAIASMVGFLFSP